VTDRKLSQPVAGALENDVSQLFSHGGKNTEAPLPVPPATALVDAAIDLFARMVFEQPAKIQESAFAQIGACISDISLTRNLSRKAAVTKNVVFAVSKALANPTNRSFRGIGRIDRSRSLIVDIIQVPISL
jgi:HEAT repeat-containing protein 5